MTTLILAGEVIVAVASLVETTESKIAKHKYTMENYNGC
jgi:hypothetical protein